MDKKDKKFYAERIKSIVRELILEEKSYLEFTLYPLLQTRSAVLDEFKNKQNQIKSIFKNINKLYEIHYDFFLKKINYKNININQFCGCLKQFSYKLIIIYQKFYSDFAKSIKAYKKLDNYIFSVVNSFYQTNIVESFKKILIFPLNYCQKLSMLIILLRKFRFEDEIGKIKLV
ncbi:hypothetical protein MHBO_002250 [Bonamia ostreae]|uniref:DH domain-containing protein n=1 Tax=Bonamia ostreae TaxID=126728 RepID=A0ABV2ALP9_9EUKA